MLLRVFCYLACGVQILGIHGDRKVVYTVALQLDERGKINIT